MTSAPALESFATGLYDSVEPVAWQDEANGWVLALYCAAIGTMFQAAEDLARDTEEGIGWSGVMDLERCPDDWLPWLAQFVGVVVPEGLTPAEQRVWIAGTDGFSRGSPSALRAAVDSTLTGSKFVFFRERDEGNAYALEVVTLTGETPDPDATLAALIAQKPAGIVLSFRTVEGQDWQAVFESGRTWGQVLADFDSWRDLRDNVEA